MALITAQLWLAPPAAAQGRSRDEALSTAELFGYLAWDHGLNVRGRQTPADVLLVKSLLRAAVRLDPQFVDACVWLYELDTRGGFDEEAARMLDLIVTADPGHEGAFALWLDAQLAGKQTIEARTQWLEKQKARGDLPPASQAMVHVALARTALQKLDTDAARRHLERAAELDPLNPDAAQLRAEMLSPEEPPENQLEFVLRALRANPLDVERAWQVAAILDELGFSERAAQFYNHALDVHRHAAPGQGIPAPYLLDFAWNAINREDFAQAADYAMRAISADPGHLEGKILLCWILQKIGRRDRAAAVVEQLHRRFATLGDLRNASIEQLAQSAWFSCILDPSPQRALIIAREAARRAPEDPFVQRVLGWALAMNELDDEAKATLEPLAATDPYAAYQLAEILKEQGDDGAPARIGAQLQYPPSGGPAYEWLNQIGALPADPPAPAERFPSVAAALGGFPQEALTFHNSPADFLDVSVRIENNSPRPGEPWWAVFTLTNRGDFPISLGPDQMVNPTILLSLRMKGTEEHEFPNLISVHVDRRRVLAPGQSVELRRNILVGPLRTVSRRTPQQLQIVSVEGLLDPVQTNKGTWSPALAGEKLAPLTFSRLPEFPTPEALHAYAIAIGSGAGDPKYRSIEVFGELLGESQRAARDSLEYAPKPVPEDRLKQSMIALLNSANWETRVRALEALYVAGLDADLFEAAQTCLEHEHWAVRLAAVRLLVRLGPKFTVTADRISRTDADAIVRDLARSYLMRWGRIPAQPAGAPESPAATPAPGAAP